MKIKSQNAGPKKTKKKASQNRISINFQCLFKQQQQQQQIELFDDAENKNKTEMKMETK